MNQTLIELSNLNEKLHDHLKRSHFRLFICFGKSYRNTIYFLFSLLRKTRICLTLDQQYIFQTLNYYFDHSTCFTRIFTNFNYLIYFVATMYIIGKGTRLLNSGPFLETPSLHESVYITIKRTLVCNIQISLRLSKYQLSKKFRDLDRIY